MTPKPLVLVVDDEPSILRLVRLELEAQGMRVLTTSTGEHALHLAEERRPDIVILDIMLPQMDGFEAMERLRERFTTPIILLTGKDSNSAKIQGLERGADDYVVKPFSPEELSARVRAVLRRAVAPASARRVIGPGQVEIDLDRRVVKRQGHALKLTGTEWRLLEQLAANGGKVLLHRELLIAVWGPEYWNDTHYLWVWISRLRSKLEADPDQPKLIKTIQGVGYRLEDENDD